MGSAFHDLIGCRILKTAPFEWAGWNDEVRQTPGIKEGIFGEPLPAASLSAILPTQRGHLASILPIHSHSRFFHRIFHRAVSGFDCTECIGCILTHVCLLIF